MNTAHMKLLAHSAIRLSGALTIYFDPFKLTEEAHDADAIFVTHDHYDHYSPDDIRKIARPDTMFFMPESTAGLAEKDGFDPACIVTLKPGDKVPFGPIAVEAVPAYNVGKKFHQQKKAWLGYVVTMDGMRYYVAGDTDENEDVDRVSCDVAFVPVGGTYTMTAAEAAAFVNKIRPKTAVPTHYAAIIGTKEDAESFVSLLDEGIGGVIL